jgi:hypothetical protein
MATFLLRYCIAEYRSVQISMDTVENLYVGLLRTLLILSHVDLHFASVLLLRLTVIIARCFVYGLQRPNLQQGILSKLQELARQLQKHARVV